MLLLLGLVSAGSTVLRPAGVAAPPARRTATPVASAWSDDATLEARRFWSFDMSGGAGAISSPVREEHLRNASYIATWGEKKGAWVASCMPRWLLLSVIGIATRELTSRDVRETLVPAIITSGEARPKARLISATLRKNLDKRVERVLAAGGFGNTRRIIDRFVEQELAELSTTVTSIEDVVENEITKGILEVLELEFADRITSSVSYAVQLNESVAASDIAGILEVADKNADGELTGDELYELIFGRPIDPAWQRLAANWVVLKAPQFAEDRWERWRSLLLAPWVSRLSRLAQLSRSVAEWARN